MPSDDVTPAGETGGLVEADYHRGFFEIALSPADHDVGEEAVIIRVSGPRGELPGLTIRDQRERLTPLLPEDVDWGRLSEAFSDDLGGWVPLCAPPEDYLPPSLAFAGISKDELSAYALLAPAPGEEAGPGVEEITKELDSAGVTAGIAVEAVEEVASKGAPLKPYVVARGRSPVDGEDTRIELLVETGVKGTGPEVLEDGRVDFRRVTEIEVVSPGRPLARKIPATAGVDGFTVTGRTLAASPGKEAELKCGSGARFEEEDPLTVLAEISGEPSFKAGVVSVNSVREVDGDVDYSVGNIQFPGTIVINGNVDAGFKLEAEGDIKINGTVDAAELVAGGDILIRGGVAGHDAGAVRAEGSVAASYLNSAKVFADGNVVVEGEIINSEVRSGQKVSVTAQKGSIVGGLIVAEGGVSAASIGSESFAPTRLEVGQRREVLKEFDEVKAALADEKKKLEEVKKGLKYLAGVERKGPLDERKAKIKQGLEAADRQLSVSVPEREARLEKLNNTLAAGTDATVSARDKIYPGTFISFSAGRMRVKESLDYVTVYEKGGEVEYGPLRK